MRHRATMQLPYMGMRATLAAVTFILGTGSPMLEVEWAGSEACADRHTLRERIEARVGGRIDPHARLAVRAEIQPLDAGRLRLTVRVDVDEDRTLRTLEAASCEEAEDAVVLIASLAVGAEAAAPVEAAEPEGVPPTVEAAEPAEPKSVPPPVEAVQPEVVPPPLDPAEPREAPNSIAARSPAPPPRQPPPTRSPPWGELGIGAGAAWGQIPGVGPLVVTRGALGRPRWLVRLGVGYAPPRRALLEGFDDRGATIQAWYASLEAGPRWSVGERVTIPVTVGLEAGAVHGAGFGVPVTHRAARPWVAGRVAADLHARVTPRFGPWISAELAVPFGRPAFEIVGRAVVFRSAPVTPRVLAGVSMHWQ